MSRQWKPKEDRYLENHYKSQSPADIGKFLARSAEAVKKRIRHLKLAPNALRKKTSTHPSIKGEVPFEPSLKESLNENGEPVPKPFSGGPYRSLAIPLISSVAPANDDFDILLGIGLTPPKEPTNAIPGTKDKINVMIRRLESGEELHHPDDVRFYRKTDFFDL